MNIFQKPKVQTLAEWLEIATKKLESAAKERIRTEIEVHYAEAVESHLADGLAESAARAAALSDLGDARIAARRFRRQHLTEGDVKMLQNLEKQVRSFGWIVLNCLYFLILLDRDLGESGRRYHCPGLFLVLEAIVLLAFPIECFLAAKHSYTKTKRVLLFIYPFSGFFPGFFMGMFFERQPVTDHWLDLSLLGIDIALLCFCLPASLAQTRQSWRERKRELSDEYFASLRISER